MAVKQTSKSKISKSIEENLIKFWSQLDVELQFSSALTLYVSGIPHPLLNGVLRTQFSVANVHDHIEKIINHFKWRKMPFCWWISQFSSPGDLGKVLSEYGLMQYGVYPGLSLELSQFDTSTKIRSDVTIDPIIDNDMMITWSEILKTSYHFSSETTAAFLAMYSQQASKNENPFSHFVAKLDGKPVGVGTLFVHEEIAGIYHLSVLPEFRQRGIGTAIVEDFIRHSINCGCRSLIAIAPDNSQGIFHTLGFQKQCQFSLYSWPAKENTSNKNPYIQGIDI